MIPHLNEHGYLPPGLHACRVEEIVERFGEGSPERQVETAELLRFLEWIKDRGVLRIIVDGSYVTDRIQPNDLDIVILPSAEGSRRIEVALAWEESWPFLHIIIATDEEELSVWADEIFGKTRGRRPKGVLEIIR